MRLLEESLSPDNLAADLLASVNISEISRRQFRDIARIAGLVFQGFPGSGKSTRQIQASSGLVYDVLQHYDPDNLLLKQSRIWKCSKRSSSSRGFPMRSIVCIGRRVVITEPRKFTPLGFPLWASRLQTQMVSTESRQTRIERAARELEAYAFASGMNR